MPRVDSARETLDIQQVFSGGMNDLDDPGQDQYSFGENIQIREGAAATRPGIEKFLGVGFQAGFWWDVGQDFVSGGGTSDFWFRDGAMGSGFEFVSTAFGNIQGVGVFNFPEDSGTALPQHRGREFILFVSNGIVVKNEAGFVAIIATEQAIATDEVITFVQANNQVVMFRGFDNKTLSWDGSANGFVVPALSIVGDSIPNAKTGIYQAGRLFAITNRDDIMISDQLSIIDWDGVDGKFAIQRGDGDELVALHPFHEDIVFAFKRNTAHALLNVITDDLPANLQRVQVDGRNGLIGEGAVVTVGEQVWYMSDSGIRTVQRTAENNLLGIDVPISAPITGLFNRINIPKAGLSQAFTSDNYVVFAAPLDTKVNNSAILAYDLLGRGGRGSWCGLWRSPVTQVRAFFEFENKPLFIDFNGVIHTFLTDDSWDGSFATETLDIYDTTIVYDVGDMIRIEIAGVFRIFEAVATSQNVVPPDATEESWIEITDTEHALDIRSTLLTRPFDFGEKATDKSLGRMQAVFRHSNPRVTLSIRGKDAPFTRQVIFEGIEYDRTKYDVVDRTNWNDSNANLDFDTSHRQDYTLIVDDSKGLFAGIPGICGNISEMHDLRFLPQLIDNQQPQIEVFNDQGRIEVVQLGAAGELEAFASRTI